MAVPPGGCVFLRDAGIGGNRAVQKVVRECGQELGDAAGQVGERAQHGLAEEDVRSRRPRPCLGWQHGDRDNA
jgi:hypothetical protein